MTVDVIGDYVIADGTPGAEWLMQIIALLVHKYEGGCAEILQKDWDDFPMNMGVRIRNQYECIRISVQPLDESEVPSFFKKMN